MLVKTKLACKRCWGAPETIRGSFGSVPENVYGTLASFVTGDVSSARYRRLQAGSLPSQKK
jgi:hypothetical protein